MRISEQELLEPQRNFQGEQGCTDKIFAVRQSVGKSIDHNTKLYADLKKAHNSLPLHIKHCGTWIALRKLGMPFILIDIIKSFHGGKKAT